MDSQNLPRMYFAKFTSVYLRLDFPEYMVQAVPIRAAAEACDVS